jgi:phage terminase large subunit
MTLTLAHRYAPRGACKVLFTNRGGEVLLSGPAGTGKSRACLEKLNICALKYPGMRALIVRKTQVSMTNTTLVTWREKVIPEALQTGLVKWYGGSQQEAAGYHYDNGSVINVGGMDNPTKIMSSDYDMVYVQEAIELTENDWESITTRLRHGRMPYQQLIADTNPHRREHWLNQRCINGQTQMLHSIHEDNPLYVNDDGTYTQAGLDYIVGKLDKLTGTRKLRLRDGKWVSAEGVVYETYAPNLHLVDKLEIPQEWPRYWTVDFGFTNPFVLQCWAEDPDGRLYLYREIYRTRRLVEDHAKDILGIVRPDGVNWIEPKPTAVICDHDAEDRATLERHLGLRTTAALKSVSDGIQCVQGRLRILGDNRPRLYLVRDAVIHRDQALIDVAKPASTIEEIVGYVWDTKEGKAPKESPVKEDDHGMDAMRYMIAYRDLRKRSGTRGWL